MRSLLSESWEAMSYETTPTVETLASWPRPLGDNILSPDNLEAYGMGLAVVASPFIVFGVLSFLVVPLFHCCRKKGSGSSKMAVFVCFLSVLLVFAGSIVGYTSNTETQNGMTTLADGFHATHQLFDVAAENGAASSDHVSLAIIALQTVRDESCPDSILTTGELEQAFTEAEDAYVELKVSLDMVVNMSIPMSISIDEIEHLLLDGDAVRSDMTLLALAVSSCVFFVGILNACFTKMRGYCCPLYWTSFLGGLIVLLFAWIVAGLNAAAGVLSADICMDPMNILSTAAPDNVTQIEVKNLFTCAENSPTFQSMDEASALIPLMNDALSALQDLEPYCTGDNFWVNYWQLSNDTADAVYDVELMLEGLQCPTVSDIFTQIIYNAMCTSMVEGFYLMLVAGTMIGLFGWIALCIMPRRERDIKKLGASDEASLDQVTELVQD